MGRGAQDVVAVGRMVVESAKRGGERSAVVAGYFWYFFEHGMVAQVRFGFPAGSTVQVEALAVSVKSDIA